jgi:uncharacterized protein
MQFLDKISLSGVKKTTDGYLVADAFAARTGIQFYTGAEVGRPDLDVVRVYRPASEVFSEDSLKSFIHIPITDGHPKEAVDSSNWAKLAKGETSTDVLRDGERLRIPLILKDSATIEVVENGKRELSVGYTCEMHFENGLTSDGVSFDVIQKKIRANHIAVVDRGRAGPEFKIGDSWGASPITMDKEAIMTTRTITVDGISIVTTDQGAQAIEKLQKQNSTLVDEQSKLAADHTVVVSAKDSEIGALKIELKKAQDALPKAGDLDKLVADRSILIADATRIAKDLKPEGLSDAEIRKAAVSSVYGEDMTKDASEAEISGMFRAATVDAKDKNPDPVRDVARVGMKQTTNDNGQAAYEKRLATAWNK